MHVILFSNDIVMVFEDGELGGRHRKSDRVGRYDALLPELLALPDEGITWMAADWENGHYLVEVTREFMEAILAGDLQRMTDLLRAAFSELSDRCPVCKARVRISWSYPIGPDSVPNALRCGGEPACNWRTDVPWTRVNRLKDLQ